MIAAARDRTTAPTDLLDAAGAAALAGLIAGVLVGGLGSRIAMRIAGAMSDPALFGIARTNNGNVLGNVTVEGTLALVFFVGLLPGVIGGPAYALCRPWLAPLGRWGGVAFGLATLAAVGPTVLEPFNIDFRKFGTPAVNVALFALLFPLFGATIAFGYDGISRALSTASALSPWRWASWGALLFLVLASVIAAGAVVGALTGRGDGGDPRSLLLLWFLAAPGLLRIVRVPRALSYAAIFAPAVVGLPSTVEAIVFLAR